MPGRFCDPDCTCRRHPNRDATCRVADCKRKVVARGWCKGHYQRWKRTGDVGDSEFSSSRPKPPPGQCREDGCERSTRGGGRGWCKTHWQRWSRTGSPSVVRDRPSGEEHHAWVSIPSYQTMHARVSRAHGKARDRQCVDCGVLADEWSYDGLDTNEVTGVVGVGPRAFSIRYSLSVGHYQPRCVTCHRRYDKGRAMS